MRQNFNLGNSSIPRQSRFVGRYKKLRIPSTAKRHTQLQLYKFDCVFDPFKYPPVVIGAKGEVLAGFAQAQMANRSILGRYVIVTRHRKMSESHIRDYTKWVKQVALRGKWDKQMLAIELQNFRKRN